MIGRETFEDTAIGQRIERLRAQLDAIRPLAPEVEARVLQKLRLDWNYHSNAIEGNGLDHGETQALLMHGITAKGKSIKDHLDIQGHNEALTYLLGIVRDKEQLREAEIRALHQMLLVKPYEITAVTPDGHPTRRTVHPGRYKDTPNSVKTTTGEVHHFATPEDTPMRMRELMAWLYGEDDVHPVERAILFHHRFVAIHPFDDGNGRMARLLMNLLLMQSHYPPAVIRQENRGEYYAALAQADAGQVAPILEFTGSALVRSMEVYLKASRGESIDEPDDVDKEISLLARDLETRQQRIDARLDEESREHFCEHVLAPVWRAVAEATLKFGRLFLTTRQGVIREKTESVARGRTRRLLEYVDCQASDVAEIMKKRVLHPRIVREAGFVQLLDFRDTSNPFGLEVRLAIEFQDNEVTLGLWVAPASDLSGYEVELPGLTPPDHQLHIRYLRDLSKLDIDEMSSVLEKTLIDRIKARDKDPNADALELSTEDLLTIRDEYMKSTGEDTWLDSVDIPSGFIRFLIQKRGLHFHPRIRFTRAESED